MKGEHITNQLPMWRMVFCLVFVLLNPYWLVRTFHHHQEQTTNMDQIAIDGCPSYQLVMHRNKSLQQGHPLHLTLFLELDVLRVSRILGKGVGGKCDKKGSIGHFLHIGHWRRRYNQGRLGEHRHPCTLSCGWYSIRLVLGAAPFLIPPL